MSQLKSKFIENAAIISSKLAADSVVTAKILDANVTSAKLQSSIALAGAPTSATAASGTNTTQIATTAFVKAAIDLSIAGLDFQSDILTKQTDATLDPGAAPTLGDRYIISNTAALHANFGAIAGVGNNDIVQYDGSAFVVSYDVSVQGTGAISWNRGPNYFEYYNGSSWGEFGGLAGITAGAGLTKTSNTLDVVAADASIQVNADSLQVKLDPAGAIVIDGANAGIEVAVDGSTLEISTNALQIKDAGITSAKLAAAVAGAGLTGGAGSALAVGAGSGITVNADDVQAKIHTATLKFNGSSEIEGIKSAKQSFTLDGTNITNQYVELSQASVAGSMHLSVVGGLEQQESVDYTLSVPVAVTRITFAGDLATAGAAALIAGDILVVEYSYL